MFLGQAHFPVAKLARLGAHSGLEQYADVKRVPDPASASSVGVRTVEWPAQPSASGRCSSDITRRTFVGSVMIPLLCAV
jgi:hypothetical protein